MDMKPKISAGTVARTIILALALVNQVLAIKGYNLIPIKDEQISELITNIFTVAAALIAWWKNNSFTKAALLGDVAMKEYRANESLEKAIQEYDDDTDK